MEKMQHFSIRKLSIGAASVLIGISFLGVKTSTVKADSLQNTSEAELVKPKATNEVIKQDADSNIKQDAGSNIKQQDNGSDIKQEPVSKVDTKQDTGSNIEQEPVSKTDAKQINNDQPNADQTPAQPVTSKPNSNQQNVADLEAKPQTPAKIKLQTNRTITPDKADQSQVKVTNLMAIAGKKLNAQMLSESKVMTPAKDTNGGFDEATWGKLNVNDWTIKTLTDTEVNGTLAKRGNLELTAYNGDEQHVIIPNLLDIYNAGKADSAMIGNLANEDSTRVVISKDLLSQFSKNVTSIAFSKTHTDHISNKDVTQMSNLTKTGIDHLTKVYSKDSDLSNAFSYFPKESDNITNILWDEAPRVKLDATNFDVSNVTNMTETFAGSNYDGLSTIADWDTSHATNMSRMFLNAKLSDLSFLSRWNTSNVTDMGRMFANNPLTNLVSIAGWNTSNVTNMVHMFLDSPVSYADLSKWDFSKIAHYVVEEGGAPGLDSFLANYNDPSAHDNTTVYLGDNKTIPSWVLDMNDGMPNYCIFRANENTGNYVIITSDSRLLANPNGAYNHLTFTDNTGKQTKVDIPMAISTENATGDFASVKQRVLDFVNAEAAKQAAATGKKWVITNTDLNDPVKIANANFKLINTSLPVLNTNDAYALDSKNGLHEHANVNDNGGYDEDYWGAIDLNNWNYTQNDAGDITLSSYKGSDNTKIIVPNIADFAHGNVTQTITLQVNPNVDTNKVYISSSVMRDLAKNATRIGLSKTANKKVIAKDAIWQDAFGGMTNKPGTDSNADGGIKYGSPNLTQMDLHNLDTAAITNMDSLFNGGSNLTTIGDLSDWDTSNVTDMDIMFQTASNLTNIGDLSKWNTSKVTDMAGMFSFASLANIGDLSKWQTGNVTNMHNMFANATNLTNIGNLDNWNTSKVTDMSSMFIGASGLTSLDLSKWQTSNVTNMHNMFANAANLTNIGNLDNWNTSKVTDMSWMFSHATNLTNIGDLSKWNTSKVTDMRVMFGDVKNLTNIGNLDNWDTSKVTDMSWMFGSATNLTNIGDLSKWQTGNVTNMHSMFDTATSLTNIGNLDNWDTNKVTDMGWMFGTESGKQSHLVNIGDLSKWDTNNVTNMSYMFYNATNLTNIGNLDNWNTNKVTNMSWMFGTDSGEQSHLTNIGDLAKWQTGNVTNMSNMFYNTKALHHLNISNWNLIKLTNKDSMKHIFDEDTNLTVIANNLKLPTWYENEINNADYFWNNHIAVITNVPELIRATGDINNLKIDNQDASRSIFYDSKGSSDAIQVLKDANNQYIADYHKANPTKFLKLADTVDQNDPIALANASFVTVPKKFNLTVHFEDVDPNRDKDSDVVKQELAKTVELSGRSGDTADLSQVQLPTNFELSGDLPSTTFGDTDSVTIQLKHKLSDEITSKENGVAHARTEVIAPDGTVLIQGGAGVQSFIDQRQDLVTGEMVNSDTDWTYGTSSNINVSSDILNKYIEQYNPAILDTFMNKSTRGWQYTLGGLRQPLQIKLKDGYTVKSAGNWADWNNNGTYTWDGLKGDPDWNIMKRFDGYDAFQIAPLDQSVHYQFMDNGTQVGSDVIVTGKTGETVAPNLSIPENYEVADGTTLPTSYTFTATNPTVQINLKHKTETSVESLPATRTINVHLPNGTTKVYQQVIGYQRDVITDLVTKMVTRGTWAMNDATSSFTIDGVKQQEHSYVLKNGNYNFASIKIPKVPGYKAVVRTGDNSINPASALFTVNFMALPKPAMLAPTDIKPTKTVTSAISMTTDVAEPVKTEPKVTVSVAPKVLDLSDDTVATTSKETTWQVANKPEQDTYRVSNGEYTVELPHIDNAQLYVIANNSAKDSVLFTYKGQNTKYVFGIKFVDGHYLLTTYEIKSGKLIKVIDYNFVSSTKISDLIKNWLKL